MSATTSTLGPTSGAAAPQSGLLRRAASSAHEVALIGTVFLLYRQVRFISQDDGVTAFANAERLLRWESTLFAVSERAVQQVALRSEATIEFLNRYYVSVHFPLTVLFVLWLLFRHPTNYRRMRNWLMTTTVIALVVHIAFPLAPPRMLPGFVDTLRVYGPNIYPADTSASMANQFAAMPSLHFGWSLIVAVGFMMTARRRWSALALLHPLITLIAIVATANHYFLDAAAAAVIVLVSAQLSQRFTRTTMRSTSGTPRSPSPTNAVVDDARGLRSQ